MFSDVFQQDCYKTKCPFYATVSWWFLRIYDSNWFCSRQIWTCNDKFNSFSMVLELAEHFQLFRNPGCFYLTLEAIGVWSGIKQSLWFLKLLGNGNYFLKPSLLLPDLLFRSPKHLTFLLLSFDDDPGSGLFPAYRFSRKRFHF